MPRPLKALILEDRPADLELMLRQLLNSDYEVGWHCVEDAASFVEALQRQSWDVILADYSMPQFDATQALEILEQRSIDTPLIVITGSISEEVAVECMQRGATDYLLKDRLARLPSAVERALVASRYRRERRAAEMELRLTQRLVDQSPLAIFRLTYEGRVAYANDAACRSLGYSAEELLALSVTDLNPTFTRDDWHASSSKLRSSRSATFESIHRRKDGSTFPVEITYHCMENGGADFFTGFVVDITERKRAHELLVESAKLRTVAGLAAGIAHEINNPLASMVQNAQVILNRLLSDLPANRQAAEANGTSLAAVRGFIEDREITQMLEAIRESGRQASGVVRNLLAYARTSAEKSFVGLNVLVAQMLELAKGDSELKKLQNFATIRFVQELSDNAPVVVCHPDQIMQALMNLLRNAAQAVGGNLANQSPSIWLRTSRVNGMGCIDVADNGPGISPELRDRLFEPFITTKPVGEGTGLGLFISHHLVTVNNGGQLSYGPRPGGGACFRILLRTEEAQ